MSKKHDDALLVAVIHFCHSVWCAFCRPRILLRRLIPYLDKLAPYWKQIRIVDLTINRECFPEYDGDMTYDLFRRIEKQVEIFIRGLKDEMGDKFIGFVRLLEFHKDGMPHFHLLILTNETGISSQIGQEVIHKHWDDKTGKQRIYENFFRSLKHFNEYIGYIGKTGYLTKDKGHQTKLPENLVNGRNIIRAFSIGKSLKNFINKTDAHYSGHMETTEENGQIDILENSVEKAGCREDEFKRENAEIIFRDGNAVGVMLESPLDDFCFYNLNNLPQNLKVETNENGYQVYVKRYEIKAPSQNKFNEWLRNERKANRPQGVKTYKERHESCRAYFTINKVNKITKKTFEYGKVKYPFKREMIKEFYRQCKYEKGVGWIVCEGNDDSDALLVMADIARNVRLSSKNPIQKIVNDFVSIFGTISIEQLDNSSLNKLRIRDT